jgi:hypothetical protein
MYLLQLLDAPIQAQLSERFLSAEKFNISVMFNSVRDMQSMVCLLYTSSVAA